MANIPTATSSPSAKGIKFKIEQKVEAGSIKRGPYAIERTMDPNEVVIKRRFGEGSKPLFERDDIVIKRGNSTEKCPAEVESNSRSTHKFSRRRSSSSESRSVERYRLRSTRTTRCKSSHSKTNRSVITGRSSARSPPPAATGSTSSRHAISEKVPYFLDEKRENDRLRRRYGGFTPPPVSATAKRKKEHSRSKTGSRTPPTNQPRSPDHSASRRDSGPRGRNFHTGTLRVTQQNFSRSREHDSDRQRRSSSGGRRDNPSASSRSQSRHRRRLRSSSSNGHDAIPVPATQIITIPVPVADYSYAYPSWPPQHPWGASAVPPSRFPPYHPMEAMLSAGVMPPLRPPPPIYGMPPYHPRIFRPQQPRYNFRYYAPRSNSVSYRSRNAP